MFPREKSPPGAETQKPIRLKSALRDWLKKQSYYHGFKRELSTIIDELTWEPLVNPAELEELQNLLKRYARIADSLNYITTQNTQANQARLAELRKRILDYLNNLSAKQNQVKT